MWDGCRIQTEVVRWVSVGCLLYATYVLAACPCANENSGKRLLACKDHDLQFAIAANMGVVIPLLDSFVKHQYHRGATGKPQCMW